MPPQAAGNRLEVTRRRIVTASGSARLGRADKGGLWVYGSCADCNSLAGGLYDRPYADFAAQVTRFLTRDAARLRIDPAQPPGVRLAPGLVARSVLFSMFALSPRLRLVVPELARDLRKREPHLRLPEQLRLRLAMTPAPHARLSGLVHAYRVLEAATSYRVWGEIFFPPLAWTLTPADGGDLFEQQGWADASDWSMFGPDVTHLDLRWLTRRLPVVPHPQHRDGDNWVQLLGDDDSPILEGHVPF